MKAEAERVAAEAAAKEEEERLAAEADAKAEEERLAAEAAAKAEEERLAAEAAAKAEEERLAAEAAAEAEARKVAAEAEAEAVAANVVYRPEKGTKRYFKDLRNRRFPMTDEDKDYILKILDEPWAISFRDNVHAAQPYAKNRTILDQIPSLYKHIFERN